MKKFWYFIYHIFNLTIALKAVNGIFEVGGSLILWSYGRPVEWLVYYLTQYEITERHNDFISKNLFYFFNNLSVSTRHFIAIYLLFHGLMNLFLVFSLWRRRLWAFPVAIVLFLIFVMYQYYRFYHNHSIDLLLISILDSFIIILTMLEYKRLQNIKEII